jgi:carboxymethylenebutenolidase
MNLVSRLDTIDTASGPLGVHVVHPDGDGPYPVVVFFHHGPGHDDGSKQTAERIAAWGYYVITHDRYHRSEPWYLMASRDDSGFQTMFGLIMGTPESQVGDDLAAVLGWLEGEPAAKAGAKACIGYCIGARSALWTIGHHGDTFRAAAGLHPSLCTTDAPDSVHLAVPSYTGSLYIGFGALDTMQPASANTDLIDWTNALDKGHADIHEGADHGFSVYGGGYHETAADESYRQIKTMFDRELLS